MPVYSHSVKSARREISSQIWIQNITSDLNKSLTVHKFIHFADDTVLYLDINHTTDHTYLNISELAQVQKWIQANKLSPIVQEANYMVI